MRLNRDALIQEADARVVARAIGMKVRKMGQNIFGECVSGLHSEKRHDNNVIYQNGCHCFSCGESYNTIDMVMKYCEVDFKEACAIVADTIGGVDSFKDRQARPVILPLTPEELELIGLGKRRDYHQIDRKDVEESCSETTAASILAPPPISLRTLYAENRDAFFALCISKAEERMQEYRHMAEITKENPMFYRVYAEKHNAALTIKRKIEGYQKKLA